MAVYTDESEITDLLIKNIKRDAGAFTTFINPYLLRADAWYIDRAEDFGIDEGDIITYAQGQKYKVKELLRYFVYIEVLKDLYSINQINDDDYFKKYSHYKKNFESLDNGLTFELVLGLEPKLNPIKITGRRITLQADLYDTTSSETRF
jgi:hypothetical protein